MGRATGHTLRTLSPSRAVRRPRGHPSKPFSETAVMGVVLCCYACSSRVTAYHVPRYKQSLSLKGSGRVTIEHGAYCAGILCFACWYYLLVMLGSAVSDLQLACVGIVQLAVTYCYVLSPHILPGTHPGRRPTTAVTTRRKTKGRR